jgi:predicted RND superfamily exporter protein
MTSTTHVGPATFGACVTSIIGFLAIGSSSVPALRDFAILGSFGLFGALIGTIFIMPAILVLTERESTDRAENQRDSRFRFNVLVDFVRRHRAIWIGLCTVLFCACLIPLLTTRDWLPLESDLTVMHPRPNAPLAAQRHIAERFGGSPGSLLVYLKAAAPDELVALAHDVRERLSTDSAKSAGITNVFGLSTLLPDPRLAPVRGRTDPLRYHSLMISGSRMPCSPKIDERVVESG